MWALSHRNRRFAVLSLLCSAVILFAAPLLHAAPDVPHILVLNSYNNGYDWSDDEMLGLRTILSQKFSQMDMSIEHLDTKKFPAGKHFPQLADLYASKYRDVHFDVVMALDNAALEFALGYRERIFPDTPLVFCGINDFQPAMIAGQPRITGVAERHDMAGTLALIRRLHPEARDVTVVHDRTRTSLAMREQLERQAAKLGTIRLHFLEDQPLEISMRQLKGLPADSAVLILSYTVEKGGRSFSHSDVARMVSSAAAVPVYGIHGAQLGFGVVGGSMMEGRTQGKKAAELAVRVLSGEAAETIPVLTGNLSRPMFDDRQLRKFRIGHDELPSDAVIINAPVSVYAVNKTAFWVVVTVSLAMSVGLSALYLNYKRRKILEKVVQVTEAKFRQLFDSAGDAIYIHAPNLGILEVNQAACDRMGYSHEEFLQLTVADINAPEQKPSLPKRMATVERDGRALYESAHVTRGGETIPIEVSSRAIEYLDRPAILSIVRDISKRKKVERREKTRLKILEQMATGSSLEELLVYIVRFVEQESPGGLCSALLANDEGTKLLHGAAPSLPPSYNRAVNGLRIKEGMGSCGTAAFLKRRVIVEDIETHPFWRGFQPARDAGLRACWSEPVVSVNGDLLGTFAIYYRSCRSPGEEEIALIESAAHMASIAIARAKSEESRCRLEEQMRQMQKIEAIGQLAGGLAHDFNNLLTPIFVYADIVKRSLPEGDPKSKKIEGIISSAQKAAELTKKLLSFGRKQILNMKVLDLNEVILSLLDLMQRTTRANVEIKTNTTPMGAFVFADRGQIEQILINFAVNAQDAISGNGVITIETGNVLLDDEYVRMNPGMKAGAHVLLSFTDNGCGMSEETLRHLFEPFFTTKPVGQGTGLGLATVYGIVKQHGGYIKVVSQPGKGTSFLIYFPSFAGEAKSAGLDSCGGAEKRGKTRNATVLVVDDNESIREMAHDLLQYSGYRVLVAETPSVAQRILHDEKGGVDLLVTDVMMPEMSGPELYERLLPQFPELPVLYISGYTFDEKVHHRLHHDRVNYLPKPFTSEQFLSAIEHAVSGAGDA